MASGSQLRVFLAGRVAVEANGHVVDEARFPGRQGRLLFAYLVAEQGRAVPRDELAEALWQDAPPATWEKALTVIASKLRSLLTDTGIDGARALTGAFGCYRLELPEGTWIDMIAATDAAAAGEDALAAGDLLKARAEGTLAASLVEQPLLPGDDGMWVEEKRRDLAHVRVRALTVLADACLRSDDPSEAARWAEQLTTLEPFRETGYRLLMEAHVEAGDRAEALRVYERCRRLLAEQLGAYPSPETESLYRGLLETPPQLGEAASNGTPPPARTQQSHEPSRRRRAALVAGAALLAGAIVAGFTVMSGGASVPQVLPNSVVRLDARTMKVAQVVPVGDAPDLVVASGGYVWITNHVLRDIDSGALRNGGDRTLTRVDPSTGGAVVVGGGLAPCGLTADPSGDVWVANCYPGAGPRDNVQRIDAHTLAFKRTWHVPGGEGFYRGLAYGGGSLWVSEIVGGDKPNPSEVTEVDPVRGGHRTIHLPHPAGDLAWSEGYGDLWIDSFLYGALMRLHAAGGPLKVVDGVGIEPAFPIVDGDVVWFAKWQTPEVGRVRAIGPADPNTVHLPLRGAIGVWSVAAGAGSIWATTPRASSLWRIDPKTNDVTRVRMPFLPTGLATDGNDIWVTVRKH